MSALIRAALRVFFSRVERLHDERVPADGPVLFVSNHPASITDAFVIGTTVPRMIHFVATVRLFRIRPLAALLARCGVIPINRRQDDRRAMRTVADSFNACYRVFDEGGAVAIFPEGISYDDDQLKPVKTGAARMALEFEDRHEGAAGLRIAPVGLTYAAKDRYRSEVLVHFGEPLLVAEWRDRHRTERREAIAGLSAEIERSLRALILDVPSAGRERLVASIKRLYLDRLRLDNRVLTEPVTPQAEELLLGQAIAQGVAWIESSQPDRLAAFVSELDRYERRLWTLGLTDQAVASVSASGRVGRPAWWTLAALAAGAPIALYGWIHRFAPLWFIEWAVDHFVEPGVRRSQTAHASMIAGLVGFGVLYAIAAGLVWAVAGWAVAVLYLISLPVTGLFAHAYVRALHRAMGSARAAAILLRVPLARRRLVEQRERLISEIEVARADYRRDVLDAEL